MYKRQRFQTIDQLQVAILQYLYSTGAGATSNDLAAFLGELFPDGLEREELRVASKTPKKKMSLDEALDFELDQLVDNDAIDPFHTTAISNDVSLPSIPTVDERPNKPQTPEPVPTAQTPSTSRTSKRTITLAFLLGMIAVVLAGWWLASDDTAHVAIASEPAGSSIAVNGKVYANAITPTEITIVPGRHEIELRRDGFEPQKISVEVTSGERLILDGPTTKLRPTAVAKPRTITVMSDPPEAVLTADDTNFGTGSGAKLMLAPDQTVRITATHPGCETLNFLVPYAIEKDELVLTLRCDVQTKEPTPETITATATNTPNKSEKSVFPKTVTFVSEPAGANVTVNGKSIGTSPATVRYTKEKTLRVSFAKDGYSATSLTRKVSSIRGCLLYTSPSPRD